MAVSRTLSFVVGLSLPGLVAFAALGEEIPTGKTEYHHVGEITTQVDGSALQLDTSGHTGVPSPEAIQLRDIAARLYRIETLLREMCADATAPFAECAALWQQQ